MKLNMVYIYMDADDDIVSVYEDWREALSALISDNEEMYIYIDEEVAMSKAEERLHHSGDNAWWDVLWMSDDEKVHGYIAQRPLIGKKKQKKG